MKVQILRTPDLGGSVYAVGTVVEMPSLFARALIATGEAVEAPRSTATETFPGGVSGAGFVNGYPTIKNNQIVAGPGDSRTYNTTEGANAGDAKRIAAHGWVDWMLEASGYRGALVGNYGQNTDTLQGIIDRLTGPGINAAQGYMLTTSPGKDAGIYIFLGGVNDGSSPISVTGPKYDTIFMALVDAGGVVVICNEMPNTNQSGGGAANYGRREYLDNWPWSSSGMTTAQKTAYAKRVLIDNSYDRMADPASVYNPKANYYPVGDNLHPGALGTKVHGEGLGVLLNALLSANGYPKRNTLPTNDADCILANGMLTGSVAITATNNETAGAGGQNKDGNGGVGIAGNLPTGWSLKRGTSLQTLLNAAQPVANAQLTITASKGTAPNGRDTVSIAYSGQLGAATGTVYGTVLQNNPVAASGQLFNQTTISATNGAQGVADGDVLYTLARVSCSAAANGLLGIAIGNTATATIPLASPGERAAFSGLSNTYDRAYGTTPAFTKDFMSQGTPIPPGWAGYVEANKLLQEQVTISMASGVPISFTLTFERVALVKNR